MSQINMISGKGRITRVAMMKNEYEAHSVAFSFKFTSTVVVLSPQLLSTSSGYTVHRKFVALSTRDRKLTLESHTNHTIVANVTAMFEST